jgi:hypothetical protein
MLKLARYIEGLLIPTVATICLLISLADLFDLLHFVGDRLPMLTFLLLSLVMEYISNVHNKCITMHKDIQHLSSEVELTKLGRVVEQIDPHLRKVLEDDYFLDILNFLQMAVRESNVHVNDWARFRHYYVRTLQLSAKTTFLSASTSITSHLWKDPVIEAAMTRFIKRGGKIRQVFFLKDAKELALPDVQAALVRLQTIGIQVSIASHTSTPNELKKDFIVEAKGKIGWELHLDGEGRVATSIVTTNQQKTVSYQKMFEKLRGSDPDKFRASQ